MKWEYIVVAVATVAAIIYYAKFDKPPKHTEAEADEVAAKVMEMSTEKEVTDYLKSVV